MLICSCVLGKESLLEEEVNSRLKTAERGCLEKRAAFLLKDSIVESLISIDSILKAIHSGASAAPSERFSPPTSDRSSLCRIKRRLGFCIPW